MSALSPRDSVASCCQWLYARLLRLYPGAFRREFEPEMRATFIRLLHEEMKWGVLAMILACLREARDIPVSALQMRFSRGPAGGRAVKARRTPARDGAFRSGAVSYGVAFALVSMAQSFGQQWLIEQRVGVMRCAQWVPVTYGPLPYYCNPQPLVQLAWMLLYYGFCGVCGAVAGAVLGLAFRRPEMCARLALAGLLSFGLGALAANHWLPPVYNSNVFGATAGLATQLILMGVLVGLFTGGAVRDWRLLFRSATTGALALAGGGLLGLVIATLLWGLAQAVASYQPVSVYTWVIQNVPLALLGIVRAAAGAIWACALAKVVVKRRDAGPARTAA